MALFHKAMNYYLLERGDIREGDQKPSRHIEVFYELSLFSGEEPGKSHGPRLSSVVIPYDTLN